MTVDAKVLALRLVLLIERARRKRFTISDKRLKDLAETKLLSIRYLSHLKDELEKLGYLIGDLAGGGFGLLVIDSLEGAFPLKADRDDVIYGLTEQQLIAEISALSLQKSQKKTKDSTLTREDVGSLLWMGLAEVANKKQTIAYGDLADELGLSGKHYNAFQRPLALIEQFCKDNKLPPLNFLVIRQDTKLPSVMKARIDNTLKYKDELDKIYEINWIDYQSKFEDLLTLK